MPEESEFIMPAVLHKHRHHPMRVALLVLLILLLMGGSGGGAYWWRGNSAKKFESKQAATIAGLQKDKMGLQKQVATLKKAATKSTNNTATCTATPPDATSIQNIEAAITSGNTAALQGYMASSVQEVYAAADAIPPKIPADAVSDVTAFVTDQITGKWSFPVSASSLAAYRAGSYAKYFPSIAVVGGSTRHRVISFSFNCSGQISTIFMAADDSVL